MLIEVNKVLRLLLYYWLLKLDILNSLIFLEEIMKVSKLIEHMDFLMNVKGGILFHYGMIFVDVLTICLFRQLLTAEYFVCMVD